MMDTTAPETCCECDQPAVTSTRCVYEVASWDGVCRRWIAGHNVYGYCAAHDPGGSWSFEYDGTTRWGGHWRQAA